MKKFFADLPEPVEEKLKDIKERASNIALPISNASIVVEGIGAIEKKIEKIEGK